MSEQRPDGAGRHEVVALPFYGSVALGNGTQWKIGAQMAGDRLLVAIEGRGAYTFRGFCHWTYAEEKLGILNGDAMNIADWINDQLGHEPSIRQGFYAPDLTSEGQVGLSEAYDHLDSMECGCECDSIGFRCIKCLRDAMRVVLNAGKKRP